MTGAFEVLVGLLAASTLLLLVFVVRNRALGGRDGAFPCSLRLRATTGSTSGWVHGVARYESEGLAWFRTFSLSPRPRTVIHRQAFVVRSRRAPLATEEHAIPAGSTVLECTVDGRAADLAMAREAAYGFLAWLESAPPGAHVDAA